MAKKLDLRGAVDMPSAVAYALAHNPEIEAAQAEMRASKHGKHAALGAFGPKLGMTYHVYRHVRKSEPTPVDTPERGTYTMGIEISQPIFQGFKLLADYQKAALQAESDAAQARQSRLSTIEAVQAGFIDYLRIVANVQSQREAMERLADQLRITRAYYEAGLKPKLDILQAEVDLREAEEALLKIEQNKETALAKLNTLLGLSVLQKVQYVGMLKYVPFRYSLEACLELAYRNRPDMRMAFLACDIAGKDRKIVQSG
ncbi:MAG: TolC family protein, partial [Desulfovibrio sp.]|nr:TolC family protein [Desulfovibrio sp.]